MFSVLDIVRRDAATYYVYGSNNRVGRSKTIGAFAVFAFLVGVAVGEASSDFLAGALSAEAILVGFSFNVLFYLVANRLTKPATYASMEHELRFERLSTLSDEVFDNVTYFNLVAIGSAVAALGLLLIGSDGFDANLHKIAIFLESRTRITREALSWANCIGRALGLAVLIFLLSESIYTFLRAVDRVRFYFSMLKTMNDDVQP
ncbi:hypothetical protein [Sphingobium yanoikuyae]|jgi:hypothetical protein|uniref:hypothetical protein n=1 Tax=Sphingobium TaxID=165695 RepID=UPI0028DB98E0|nr:hypothetical protein [Sphingobium yanoikuyae]